MSTAIFPSTISRSERSHVEQSGAVCTEASCFNWKCAVTAVLLFSVFYVAEHIFDISITIQSLGSADFVDQELDETVSGGSLLRKIAFPALGLWGAFLIITPARPVRHWDMVLTNPLLYLMLGLFGVAICSPLWADVFGFSMKRVLVVVFGTLAGLGLARGHTPRQLTDILIVVILSYMVFGVFAEISVGMFRPWMSEYRFSGTTHPNNQAVMDGILILACMARVMTDRKADWRLILIAAFAFVIMVMTKSRTVLFGCLIAMSVLAMLRTPWQLIFGSGVLGITLLSGFLCFAAIAGMDIADDVFAIFTLGRTDETSTLTGRIPLWEELFGYINQRPLLGHGYGSFWTPDRILKVSLNQGWQIPHAHSGYVETLLNLGYGGLLLLLTLMMTAFSCSLWRSITQGRLQDLFALGIVIYSMVFSLTDTAFAAATLPALVLITVMWTLALDDEASEMPLNEENMSTMTRNNGEGVTQ